MENETTPRIAIGSCAWSFEQWRGSFYPRRMPQAQWLEHYARFFSAVEVDATFHHIPSPHAVQGWLQHTPPHFKFTCKLPRQITHEARLRDSEDPLAAFLDAFGPMRERLGCILIQLPHTFQPSSDEAALKAFVRRLPPSPRFAVEFRHPAWHTPRITQFLEEHRVCWAWCDVSTLAEQNLAPFELLPVTADFLYIRLLGDLSTKYHKDGTLMHTYGSLLWPREPAIESWAAKIRNHLDEFRRIYIFASNHFEGFSPLTCQRLARQLDIALDLPDPEPGEAEPADDSQLSLL